MAAAALKRATGPTMTVRLVESEDIGIVGVGEATVPTIRDFNRMIGLDETAFMRDTQATLKLGIEFVDWGDVGRRYFHPFGVYGTGPDLGDFHQLWLTLKTQWRAEDLDAYSLCAMAAAQGRAGMPSSDPASPLSRLIAAFHFDAGLYARHLRGFCERLGVERHEGRIVEVVQRPDDGFIDRVRLDSGHELDAELFIDCTGFRGLLIEGALKAGYADWSHWLPMNRAVAVPCARVAPVTPFTRSTADKAGWRWRIPLQHRTGNGYVYCDAFIEDQAAEDALMAGLDGEALAQPRRLSFHTGTRRKHWDKNVVALGLSSGFIEPLESTSIHLIHVALNRLLQHFPAADFNLVNIDSFNRRMSREVEQVRDFVILHYHLTNRRDAPLWRKVAGMAIPDSLKERVDIFRERGLLYPQSADDYFAPTNWLAVMVGQGVEPRMHNPLYDLGSTNDVERQMSGLAETWRRVTASIPLHDDFLRTNGLVAH